MSSSLLEQLIKLQNIDLEIKVIQKELNFLSYQTDQHRQEMEEVLKNHTQERSNLCTGIKDPALLSRITRLQTRYLGIFLAPVVDSTCYGCRTTVPAGLMVQLVRGDRLVYCESCGRILRKVDPKKLLVKPMVQAPPKRGRKPKQRPIF